MHRPLPVRQSRKLSCPHSDNCEMFRLLKLAGALRTWQIRYCAADFEVCARFQLAQQGRRVPQTLMPNGQHLRFSGGGDD